MGRDFPKFYITFECIVFKYLRNVLLSIIYKTQNFGIVKMNNWEEIALGRNMQYLKFFLIPHTIIYAFKKMDEYPTVALCV